MNVAGLPVCRRTRSPTKPQGRQPERRAVPVRRRGDHHRHPRGDAHRQAVPDQGLVRLRDQPDARAARTRRRRIKAIQTARPAGGRRHDARARSPAGPTWCCPRPPILERYDDLQRRAACRAAAASRCASRWCRRRTTRSRAGGSPSSWPRSSASARTCRCKDIEEYLDYRAREGRPRAAPSSKTEGVVIGPKQPIYVEDGAASSSSRHAVGQDRVLLDAAAKARASTRCRSTRRPPRPPTGYFRLLIGRAPVHTFSRTQTNPLLHEPDAGERGLGQRRHGGAGSGLKNGEYVRLKNQDGVRQQPRQGQGHRSASGPTCVYMVHGFGHTSKMLQARATARAPATRSSITRYATDPLMGGTGMHVNFVTFEKEA
ncbi:MAG: hypothetical protein MZV64_30770 [Ignavibacteriales bacterium]|nr:hypothetical protein [Ignavibacteriales bacterium]